MSSNPYDLLVDYFDDIYPFDEYEKTMSSIKKEIEKSFPDNDIKLLDLGCGTGRSLRLFKSERFKLIGLDNSSLMLEKAKRNLSDFEIDAELINQDVIKLDSLGLEPQDCVTILGATIHHFDKDQRNKIIKAVYSILSKQGIFILDIAKHEEHTKFKEIFKKGCQNIYRIIEPGISYLPTAEYNGCAILQFKKIIKRENKDIVIFYHYFYFKDYFRQIIYIIETENGQHKKTIYAPMTAYYIDKKTIFDELKKAGFKVIKTIETDYRLTEFIMAKKSF